MELLDLSPETCILTCRHLFLAVSVAELNSSALATANQGRNCMGQGADGTLKFFHPTRLDELVIEFERELAQDFKIGEEPDDDCLKSFLDRCPADQRGHLEGLMRLSMTAMGRKFDR